MGTSSYIIGAALITAAEGAAIASFWACDPKVNSRGQYDANCDTEVLGGAALAAAIGGTLAAVATSNRFELDAGDHHDHLLCVHCGKVVEFCDEAIERRQQAVAEANGFVLQDHSMLLYGVCADPDCRRRAGLVN